MTLPASGSISISDCSVELGQAPTFSDNLGFLNSGILAAFCLVPQSIMAKTVDNGASPKRCPGNLNQPNQYPNSIKQKDINYQHDDQTNLGGIDLFQPIIGAAYRIDLHLQGSWIAFVSLDYRGYKVVPGNNLDPLDRRGVRVTRFVCISVVFAVSDYPFTDIDPISKPKPKPKGMLQPGVELHRLMSHSPV